MYFAHQFYGCEPQQMLKKVYCNVFFSGMGITTIFKSFEI